MEKCYVIELMKAMENGIENFTQLTKPYREMKDNLQTKKEDEGFVGPEDHRHSFNGYGAAALHV